MDNFHRFRPIINVDGQPVVLPIIIWVQLVLKRATIRSLPIYADWQTIHLAFANPASLIQVPCLNSTSLPSIVATIARFE